MHDAIAAVTRFNLAHSALFLDQMLPIFLEYFSLLSGSYNYFSKNASIIIISMPNC